LHKQGRLPNSAYCYFSFFYSNYGWLPTCKKQKNNVISFTYREARVLCDSRMYDVLLEIAIADPVKRGHNRKVWEALSNLNAEFLKPLSNAEDAEERLAKSLVVQAKAVAFVENFTDTCGKETATLYCHHAMAHIPQMVRDSPVDISDLSQQYVEHALKQGKSDMHNFTNKRVRDETNDKSRNYQVMAKDRERVHLKRELPMPLNRNEKRQLGDGSKEAEKAVQRAVRKGGLASRSNAQIDKKLEKKSGERAKLLEKFHEEIQLTVLEKLPQPAALNPLSRSSLERPLLEATLAASGARAAAMGGAGTPAAVPAEIASAMRAAWTEPGLGGGTGAAGGAQTTQQGTGRGVRMAAGRGRASAGVSTSAAAGRGAGAGAGVGRGRGARGRGRGRTSGGRWIPAGAMALD
jgi:hypothetical protein